MINEKSYKYSGLIITEMLWCTQYAIEMTNIYIVNFLFYKVYSRRAQPFPNPGPHLIFLYVQRSKYPRESFFLFRKKALGLKR